MNMRELFEAEARQQDMPLEQRGGFYMDGGTYYGWIFWQLAWAAAAQECARACESHAGQSKLGEYMAAASNCAAACNRIAEGE